MRLSCGAKLEWSQTEDYLRDRGAVSFRRMLDRPCTKLTATELFRGLLPVVMLSRLTIPGVRPATVACSLGVSDELVDEVDNPIREGLSINEAHGLLVAHRGEEALAGPECKREHL